MPYASEKVYLEVLADYIEKLNTIEEDWKPLIYGDIRKDCYLISNHGRIFSILRNIILKPIERSGQTIYGLSVTNDKARSFIASRLVAFTFVPIPNDLIEKGYDYSNLVVMHINGIVSCNAAFNLTWTIKGKNIANAHKLGTINNSNPTNPHRAILTEDAVHEICKYLEKGMTFNEIIKESKYNVTIGMIIGIKHGKTWKRISCNYNIPCIHRPKLSLTTIENIRNDISNNIPAIDIAKKYKTTTSTIYRIKRKYSNIKK